jgi:NRPS condensation-like uncharacterized protein
MKQGITSAGIEPIVDSMGESTKIALFATLEFDRPLSAPLLRRALDQLSVADPVLTCSYERRFFRSRWLPTPATERELEEHFAPTAEAAQELEAEFIATPFHRTGERPLRLRLVHRRDGDLLLVRASHLLVDGGGMKNLLYRLAEAYRRLALDPDWSPRQYRTSPRGGRRLALAVSRLPLKTLAQGWWHDLLSYFPRPTVAVPMADLQMNQLESRMAHRSISPERVAALKARWHGHHITLNDLLLTAFTRAVVNCFPQYSANRHLSVYVTSDLRKHIPPEEHLTNLSHMRVLQLGRGPWPERATDHLHHVALRTRQWKAEGSGLGPGLAHYCLAAPLLPDGLVRWAARRSAGPADSLVERQLRNLRCRLVLTNIGQLDQERLDFGQGPCRAAHIDPPVGLPPGLVTAATGYRGRVTFSMAYCHPALADGDVKRLLNSFDDEMKALEQPTPATSPLIAHSPPLGNAEKHCTRP